MRTANLQRILILLGLFSAIPATADPIEDFYRGKQIRIYIRAAPGGNYDIYSRVLAHHAVHSRKSVSGASQHAGRRRPRRA